MRYNLITVCNSEYFVFAELFIKSLYENVNLNNLKRIFIFDTGLTESQRVFLESFLKVKVCSTQLNTPYGEMHDGNWGENVYSKTKFLLSTLQETNSPTVMVDVDSVFQKDFFQLLTNPIFEDCDFAACSRERDGFSSHIGSFFAAINVEVSKSFVSSWVEEINLGNEQFKESFALSRAIKNTDFNVLNIPEEQISNFTFSKNAYILHLKSDPERDTINKRITSYNEYQKRLNLLPI